MRNIYYNDDKEKIIYVNNSSDNDFLNVLLAGITYPNNVYGITKEAGSYYVFEYIVSGSGIINHRGTKYSVGAGDFYYLAKSERFDYHADKNDPYEKIWVNVNGKFFDSLTELYAFDKIIIRHVNVRQFFLEIHDVLLHMTVEEQHHRIKELSKMFFELISEVQHPILFPETVADENGAGPIKNYVDNNIYCDINLDDIAEHFHVTKMHVIRLFKREFEVTPMQYVITKRIEIAKNLLINTNMPIKEISSLLKYSNTQHFSNTYKKSTGISPNRQRQERGIPDIE